MVKKKTCVFISGKGSNLKNLISHSRDNNFPIKISLILCDNRNANGIKYAKKYNIPYFFINTKIKNYENKILINLKNYKINFICLAGYMKIISNKIIKNFKKKIINIHPSILPKYKGLNTGCTVHYVNEKLDNGKIIIKKIFYISSEDDERLLKQKTQRLEYKAFPEAIVNIFRNI